MTRRRRRSRQKRARWKRRLILALLLPSTAFVLFEASTWPDVAKLRRAPPKTTAFIERYREQHGRRPAHVFVRYDRIAKDFKHAVIAGEDVRFLFHDGFETHEIKSAVEDTLLEGKRLRGASTITQQLAKNLWLSPSRNPLRKVKEALLTVQLERTLSKRRILEIYMNVVELGPGVFGVEVAARHWFGKSAADLSSEEAVALAAMLPSPRRFSPARPSEAYRLRIETVRRRMEKTTHIRERL